MTRVESELPFFFGRDGELFGIYHAASGAATKAVLLCAPLGQEYIRCHRLYRQLASALAAEGIPVLRFDYYGCGDSAGASNEVDWDRCLRDIATAAAELRSRSGVDRVSAFGARLGASLALAAAPTAQLTDLVAWDPVIDGRAYVATIDALQDALRCDTHRFVRPRAASEANEQWLGFPVSAELRRRITSLRVEGLATPSLLIDSLGGSAPDWRGLVQDRARVHSLQLETPWDELTRIEVAILSHPLVQTVAAHLRERSYA
jgi:alpha-beta hydrolase superfamily lysophospholipase